MDSQKPNYWQIVEEDSFDRQRKKPKLSSRMFDDAFEGVCFALSRSPDEFPAVEGLNLRRLRLDGFSRMPDYNIWFSIENPCIRLRWIEVNESDDSE